MYALIRARVVVGGVGVAVCTCDCIGACLVGAPSCVRLCLCVCLFAGTPVNSEDILLDFPALLSLSPRYEPPRNVWSSPGLTGRY